MAGSENLDTHTHTHALHTHTIRNAKLNLLIDVVHPYRI